MLNILIVALTGVCGMKGSDNGGKMNMNFHLRLFIVAIASSYAAYANNIESWNTVQGSTKLDRFAVGVSEELRIGTDQAQTTKKIDEIHATAFVDFNVIDWLSIGIQDDYVLLRNGSDARYRRDNRPGINVSFKHSFNGFDLMNRSRFVMRDLQDERPYFRYRNLTKAFKKVKLFTAYEWYFDEGSKDRRIRKNDKFCQFWTDFGIRFKLTNDCDVDLFYRLVELKSTANHDWSPGHVIGTCISIVF